MNLEVESCNGNILVMKDGLKIDWIERHHINPLEGHYELLVDIVR